MLRGTATSGKADARIAAVVEASGPLAGCQDLVQAKDAELRTATTRSAAPPLVSRSIPYAAPWKEPPPVVQEVARACAGLPAAIGAAVQHADACSPYLPGRRGAPPLLRHLRVNRAAAALALAHARRAPVEAARWLMDALRLNQDLARGGTSFILVVSARAASSPLLSAFEHILNEARLDEAALAAIARELEILAASEPELRPSLAGERQGSELDVFLRQLKPGWKPPFAEVQADPPARENGKRSVLPSGETFTGNERDDLVLAWAAARKMALREEAACARADTLRGCMAALRAEASAAQARAKRAPKHGLRKLISEGAAGAREMIEDVLAGVAAFDRSRYLARAAERGFYLAALRLHVAALRARHRTGAFPAAEALARLPEAKEPLTGLPLAIEASDGALWLRPPAVPEWQATPPSLYVVRTAAVK